MALYPDHNLTKLKVWSYLYSYLTKQLPNFENRLLGNYSRIHFAIHNSRFFLGIWSTMVSIYSKQWKRWMGNKSEILWKGKLIHFKNSFYWWTFCINFDSTHFAQVKAMYPMSKYRDMLDFMDTAVLDFLIGNSDRHDFLTFKYVFLSSIFSPEIKLLFSIFNSVFGENSFHIHYDNGRAFGRPSFDYMALLAPLTQCCFIRVSTLKKLLE